MRPVLPGCHLSIRLDDFEHGISSERKCPDAHIAFPVAIFRVADRIADINSDLVKHFFRGRIDPRAFHRLGTEVSLAVIVDKNVVHELRAAGKLWLRSLAGDQKHDVALVRGSRL